MKEQTAHYRDDLEQLRQRFTEWRKTHTLRSKFPEELKLAAAQLVQHNGIETVVQALKVDKPSLEKWTARLQQQRSPIRKANVEPTFVELFASAPPHKAAGSCLIEVESRRGSKLKLELNGVQTSELTELIRAFAMA
jgi:transposase-like protein